MALLDQEQILCTFCRSDLPVLPLYNFTDNPITNTFYGRHKIELGFAFLIYRKKGITQNLIHNLKYHRHKEIGIWLGKWVGSIMSAHEEFQDIDFLIPVPLHSKRLQKRGYNQVDGFAEEIGLQLQTPVIRNSLIRIDATKTQTFKARLERFSNVNTKFILQHKSHFRDKHIALVDDVITTGATLEACASEFRGIEGCKISIITMAYTE